MIVNQFIILPTARLLLVPYEAFHVLPYHNWMLSEELQQLTASEPLSLDEEYQLQKSWRNDSDKLTFILLDKPLYQKEIDSIDLQNALRSAKRNCDAEMAAMIGDVNLFILPCDEEGVVVGELEVMIARSEYRGHGRGSEALLALMIFARDSVGVTRFVAKIGLGNQTSRRLFERLGFSQVSISEVFQEVELSLTVDELNAEQLIDGWEYSQIEIENS